MDPLSYARHLEGELDDHFAGAFNGMALKREAGTMIRTDSVRDQADLACLSSLDAPLSHALVQECARSSPRRSGSAERS